MKPRTRLLAALPAALLLAALLLPGAALAHERRELGGGKFVAVVGWDKEPAVQDQLNAASVRIMLKDGEKPVEGLERTLKLTIAFGGGQPREFPLRTVFRQPGSYVADIQPSKPGTYLFHLTGTLEEMVIDETFESGPGRFDDVADLDAVRFPAVEAETSTVRADLEAVRTENAAVRTLAIAGLALGGVGLLAALAGFALRPRRA